MGGVISKIKKYNYNKRHRQKHQTHKPLFNNADEVTIDRFQVLHHFYRDQWKGNFHAPIKEMLKGGGLIVLDVGCGSGTWTCDMSADFPLNLYFGVEILPIFPREKPRNILFMKNDILEGLPFHSNTFDYIHIRFMTLNIKHDEWQDKVINEIARVLRPGGYLEIMDNEITVSNSGPNVQEFFDKVHAALRLENYNPTVLNLMKEYLINSGCFENEDIRHTMIHVPMGSWGGKLGEIGMKTYYSLLKMFASIIAIPTNDVEPYLDMINEEVNAYQSCVISHRFVARKSLYNE